MQPPPNRLEQITRCMYELELMRAGLKAATGIDSLNWLHGQMDWLEELHRLLHEWSEQ